jgi:hypothetical protein
VAAELDGDGLAECLVCGATWVAGVDRRSNAVYCSRRCVMKAWRARKENVRRTVTVTVARTRLNHTSDQTGYFWSIVVIIGFSV